MKLKDFWYFGCICVAGLASEPAVAKERLSVALNIDPAFMAMTYGIRNGKVETLWPVSARGKAY